VIADLLARALLGRMIRARSTSLSRTFPRRGRDASFGRGGVASSAAASSASGTVAAVQRTGSGARHMDASE